MRADQTTVVVTGLGATSPVGGDVATTWESLLAGRSGARRLPDDWAPDLPVQDRRAGRGRPGDGARPRAGAAAGPVRAARDRRRPRGLGRRGRSRRWTPERLGVVVSSGIGGITSIIAAYDTMNEKGWQRLSPYTVPMLMPNGSAGWIGIELSARAGVHTTVSACASGAEAIGYAIDMIRSGRADVVVAGGTEAAILPLNIAAFAAMRALSTRNDEPRARLAPVRQGPGRLRARGGRGHRGARVGRARGRARGDGARGRRRRRLLLRRAPHRPARPGRRRASSPPSSGRSPTPGCAAGQVVHVNAHATSTPAGDVVEGQAIAAALGAAADGVVVSATKSMTGHLLGGAGALESVATILALRERVAPPTINLDDPTTTPGSTSPPSPGS